MRRQQNEIDTYKRKSNPSQKVLGEIFRISFIIPVVPSFYQNVYKNEQKQKHNKT